MKPNLDPRIDAYIAKAAPFARPILQRLRKLVHQACPEAEETIKWSSPFFLHHGKILCLAASFKAHLAFGFWSPEMKKVITRDGRANDGRGLLGKIRSLDDLPDDRTMLRYIRTAMELLNSGAPTRAKSKPRPALPIPPDLAAALKNCANAAVVWEKFAPSHRREYIEWITEAKRPETRTRRLVTTLEWLAQGKSRNWKYENC